MGRLCTQVYAQALSAQRATAAMRIKALNRYRHGKVQIPGFEVTHWEAKFLSCRETTILRDANLRTAHALIFIQYVQENSARYRNQCGSEHTQEFKTLFETVILLFFI